MTILIILLTYCYKTSLLNTNTILLYFSNPPEEGRRNILHLQNDRAGKLHSDGSPSDSILDTQMIPAWAALIYIWSPAIAILIFFWTTDLRLWSAKENYFFKEEDKDASRQNGKLWVFTFFLFHFQSHPALNERSPYRYSWIRNNDPRTNLKETSNFKWIRRTIFIP